MHIGLIGGIGPAATDYYYRGLIERHAKADTPLELTIAHADVRELAANASNNDAQKQADSLLRLVQRLAAAGARAAAITSITGHFCIRELAAASPLPIVNLIPEIDAAITRKNLKTVGLLGTRTAMTTRLYGGLSAARVVLPEGDALDAVHDNYLQMAIAGRVTEAQRRTFFSIGQHLCRVQGAEAVILGGTDLFLAFAGEDCGFSVIDCADIHVEALFRRSSEP